MDTNAAEQAIARIIRMRQEAEELTKALGLPPETTYTVMAAMQRAKTSLATTQQVAHQAQPEAGVSKDERLKEQVYQLSEGFLGTQMKTQLSTLQTIWERVKTLPIETLAKLGQLPAVSQGLSFTGENQQVYQVVSVISWVVLNQPTFQAITPDEIERIIIREAKAHGCSLALSYALAHYLQPHLMNN